MGLKYSEKDDRSCKHITLAVILLGLVSPIAIGQTSPLAFGRARSRDADNKGIMLDGTLPSAMRIKSRMIVLHELELLVPPSRWTTT